MVVIDVDAPVETIVVWWAVVVAAALADVAAAMGCVCAAVNNISMGAGPVAVAKVLESEQCGLTSLNLRCEVDSYRIKIEFG